MRFSQEKQHFPKKRPEKQLVFIKIAQNWRKSSAVQAARSCGRSALLGGPQGPESQI
jgi:hypothetical protein